MKKENQNNIAIENIIFEDSAQNASNLINSTIQISENILSEIYESLNISTSSYNPETTIDYIKKIFNDNQDVKIKILYYTLSNYFFSLNDKQQGVFITNILNLITYLEKDKENLLIDFKDDNILYNNIFKFSIKLFDHSNLASKQLRHLKDDKQFFENHIMPYVNEQIYNNEVKFKDITKKAEKDYITILGIFIAIILAFIGNIIFPIELLKYISNISIPRIILIFSGFVYISLNTLYLLFKFIMIINKEQDKSKELINIKNINKWLMLIFIFLIVFIFFYRI